MIVGWVGLAVVTVFTCLTFTLIVLHIYLMCAGQTTYDYFHLGRSRRNQVRPEIEREIENTEIEIGEERNSTQTNPSFQVHLDEVRGSKPIPKIHHTRSLPTLTDTPTSTHIKSMKYLFTSLDVLSP